jgi:hypothetical protein
MKSARRLFAPVEMGYDGMKMNSYYSISHS